MRRRFLLAILLGGAALWGVGLLAPSPPAELRAPAARLRVATGATLDAPGWRRRARAVAAVNGGFFDPAGRSLGLRIARGRRTGSLHPADWGVFYVRGGRAHIVHTRGWRARRASWTRGVSEAIQCGPRLVVGGRPTHLKPQWARRTGIGVGRDGRVTVAVSEGRLSFRAWAALWAASGGLDCRDALNLDGGGSTQLSLQASRQALEIGGAWPVPDAVLVQ